MKFRDFTLKRLLASTDYLVGYDANGNYIRISKDDLAASVASNVTMPTLQVHYSANGLSWHDRYSSGDIYLRIKAGSGEWSSAIRICVSAYDIWREQGNTGDEEDFLESMNSKTVYTSHCGVLDSNEIYIDEIVAGKHIVLDDYSDNIYAYKGEELSLSITVSALFKRIGQKQHVTIVNQTENDVSVTIYNGDDNILLAEEKFSLPAGSAVIMDILTVAVGEVDDQCCNDNIDGEYVTKISSHIVGKIDKESEL